MVKGKKKTCKIVGENKILTNYKVLMVYFLNKRNNSDYYFFYIGASQKLLPSLVGWGAVEEGK